MRIALTGGIASGKTTVAECFAALGVGIIDTDQIARDVVEPGTPALAKLVENFGPEILGTDGRMDRRRMRERVFADANERRKLEAITHPAIVQELARRSAAIKSPYHLIAIPLLVEGGNRSSDRVLLVDCAEEEQVRRLMARDRSDLQTARGILAAQAPRCQRLSVADDIIMNSGDPAALQSEVIELHALYSSLALAT
jgi:dephospho-CoA kinase